MAGPRLGVAFGVIYPRPLAAAELPDFCEEPRAGALGWLLRKVGTHRVVVYRDMAERDADAVMHAWLFAQYRRYFVKHGLDDPTGHAMGAIGAIECTIIRPPDLDYDVAAYPDQWPIGADLSAFLIKAEHPPAV